MLFDMICGSTKYSPGQRVRAIERERKRAATVVLQLWTILANRESPKSQGRTILQPLSRQ